MQGYCKHCLTSCQPHHVGAVPAWTSYAVPVLAVTPILWPI
jgi:hypothetical protein